MARSQQGILGDINGNIAEIIGSHRYGKSYYRSKPKTYNDAQTPVQLNQRANFIACTKLAKSIKTTIIDPIWKRMAVQMSGYNFFIKKNIAAFSNNGQTIDYTKLQFSQGNLTPPSGVTARKSAYDKTRYLITWKNTPISSPDSPYDKLTIVVMDNSNPIVFNELSAFRSDTETSLLLPGNVSADLHCYIFFENPSTHNFSPSSYCALID